MQPEEKLNCIKYKELVYPQTPTAAALSVETCVHQEQVRGEDP
jgi:hypothetical protein